MLKQYIKKNKENGGSKDRTINQSVRCWGRYSSRHPAKYRKDRNTHYFITSHQYFFSLHLLGSSFFVDPVVASHLQCF